MTTEQVPSKESFSWPTSKGDPIGPVWSYGGKKGMYQAEALRAFAHDLVDRIKEFELPVREAMKAASGDGLDAFAYCRLLQRQKDNLLRALAAKQAKIDALMLEFCPGEMSAEQRAEYAKAQQSTHEPPAEPVAEIHSGSLRWLVDDDHPTRTCGQADLFLRAAQPLSDQLAATQQLLEKVVKERNELKDAAYQAELQRLGQPPAPEWQPIGTASHEHGSNCIVAVPNYNNKTIKNPPMLVGEAHYIYDENPLSGQGWYWAGEDPTDAHGPGVIYPTHWMPLPSPPTKPAVRPPFGQCTAVINGGADLCESQAEPGTHRCKRHSLGERDE